MSGNYSGVYGRRIRALNRLKDQLKLGLKMPAHKGYNPHIEHEENMEPLTDSDKERIKKEIGILEVRTMGGDYGN